MLNDKTRKNAEINNKDKPVASFYKEDYPYKAIGSIITDIESAELDAVYEIKCNECKMSIRLQGEKLKITHEILNCNGCLNCRSKDLVVRMAAIK